MIRPTKGNCVRVILALAAVMTLVPLLQAQNYAPYSLGITGKTADITADKKGNLHIIWVTNLNELCYGRIVNNQVVNRYKVTTIAAGESNYGRPRVAVRNDGKTVHLVWGKTTLSHAWRDSAGVWRVETVRSAVLNREYLMAVCAVTQDETVHVLFQYWNAAAEAAPMMYIRKPSGGAWGSARSLGSSAGAEYRDPSVFVDGYDGLHVSWRGLLTSPSASYRYAAAGTLLENARTEFIPMASDVTHNAFGDLFVDENGRVHRPIATWTRRSTVSIDYSYKNLNGSFSTPTRPSIGDLATALDSNPSVAVAPTGQVFVSFRDFKGGQTVTYLSILDDGTWAKYIVDPSCGTSYNQFYKTSLTATSAGVYGLWRAGTGTFMLGVGAVPPPSASVIVTSPDGTENWPSGSTRSITWTTDNISDTVDIVLFRNFAQVGVIASSVPSSPGAYAWTVGDYNGGIAPKGQGYRVRVGTSDGSYRDLSDCAFTIGEAVDPSVTVTSPNGGESLALGSNRAITWSSANWDGNVDIYLDQSGSPLGTIATGIAAGSRTYTWTVGNFEGGVAEAGSGYKIRIETSDGSAVDSSDATFSLGILNTPLVLTAPSGGESWAIGSIQRISWTSDGVSGDLNIYLYKGTANLGLVASGVQVGDGGYDWKAGYLKNGAHVDVSSSYRLSIVSALDANVSAMSATAFGLVKPKISVTSPVKGTIWKSGSSQGISWKFTGVSGTVDISLYKDGVLKGQIAHDIQITDLNYPWTVGALIGGSVRSGTGFSIRISAVSASVRGSSNGTFTIQ